MQKRHKDTEARRATVERKTKETRRSPPPSISTARAPTRSRPASASSITCSSSSPRHSLIDITLKAKGDLHIDQHHTTEDTGIVLGQAVAKALGDKTGIARYGYAYLPMDETLTRVALDVSGRPFLVWKVEFTAPKIGEMDTELFRELFQAFAQNAGHHAARRDALRREQPPYRRDLLQGAGPGACAQAVAIDQRQGAACPRPRARCRAPCRFRAGRTA